MLNPALMDKCLFIPAWWLPSYCAATSSPRPLIRGEIAPTNDALKVGSMLPDGDAEMSLILLAAVSALQAQLLKSPEQNTVRLSAKDLRKRVTTPDLEAVNTVLQALPQLRILAKTVTGALQPWHLFTGEQWTSGDKTRGEFGVQMQLTGPGAELLLGYTDGYAEFLRAANDKPRLTDMVSAHAPLMLWKSVWADLAGVERLLYVRLEKAMQWDFRWLQLDGIFGLKLDDLFADLFAPVTKPGVESEDFAWRRKLLERVGKKLVDHGVMQGHVDSHYLAVGADRSADFNLAWQVSQTRLVCEDVAAYQDAAMRTLVAQRGAGGREKLIELFGDETTYAALRSTMQTVLGIADKQPSLGAATPKSGTFIDLATLFVEWSARISQRSIMKLPEAVRQSYFAQCVGASFATPLEERFVNFVNAASDAMPQLVELLREPAASFAVDDTQLLPEFKEFARTKRRRPEAIIPRAPVSAPPAQVTTPVAPKSEAQAPLNMQMNKAPSFNIKRLAGEELARMRHKDPKRYLELKQNYLRSLEPTRKKMILEVQQQMQPEMFDEHLKHSLIKFMLENPSSWSSAVAASTSIPVPGRLN